MSRRSIASLLLLAGGVAVVALMVRHVGIEVLIDSLTRVRHRAHLLLLPYALVYVLDALGWYFAFGAKKPRLGAFSFFSLRMAGESLNNVTPLGYLGGEPVKALLLRRFGLQLADGLASVVIAKTLMTAAQVVFVLAGCLAILPPLSRERRLGAAVFLSIALLGAGIAAFAALQRRGLLGSLGRAARRFRLPVSDRHIERLRETDERLADFYRGRRRDFALCFGFFLLGWIAGVPEVLWMLQAMGREVTLPEAFAIESLATVVKLCGFMIPGSLGAQEAGIVGLLALLGFGAEVSVPFSLLRRAREILWISFGLGCLAWHARGRRG